MPESPRMNPAEYDQAERLAIIDASYPAIRAFAPAAFAQVNFPARVTDFRELIRYADIMCEAAPPVLLEEPYTAEELELVDWLCAEIRSLTKQQFGRAIQPFKGPLAQFPLVRVINALSPKRDAVIWELGPGSGHLGGYLLKQGYRYRSMDNTQALYLWQDLLFSRVASSHSNLVNGTDTSAQCVMMPWWKYAKLYREAIPAADIVVIEAALGEMNYFGLCYNIALAKQMLANSPIGVVLFRRPGEYRINTAEAIDSTFHRFGFAKQMIGPVTCWSASPRDFSNVQMPNPTLKVQPFHVRDDAELPEAYGFFKFLGFGGA
jgi:hypothetical protein